VSAPIVAPRPAKRRRRKRVRTPEDQPARPDPEPSDPEPSDPELRALVAAFERGDYAHVRQEAPVLAARAKDPAVRRVAADLTRRVEPDPISVYLIALAGVLLVFLAAWYWTHPHGQP
jgi:hypothetical protein